MNRNLSSLLLVVAVLAAGCATPRSATTSSAGPEKGAGVGPAGPGTAALPSADVTEASLRTNGGAGSYGLRDDLKNVQFDFDSAKLSGDALAVLKTNAEVVKGNPGLQVLVTGNCDERGTVAYNLALGQKRAKAVRDYY